MHRTSIAFPEKLFRRAKLRAATEGTTVSEILRKLLERWVLGEVSIDARESEELRKSRALGSFGMWADRDPDAVLEVSRRGLFERDRELTDARLGSR